MSSGGARNRSGPRPDPRSARSERRGLVVTSLPAEGFSGKPPAFPLVPARVLRWESEDGRRWQVVDADATRGRRKRELELWRWAWKQPQACAWAMPSESWRVQTVAMWVRTFAICESPEATASEKTALLRLADQVGLTPAGLKENGWAIASDELAQKAAEHEAEASPAKPRPRRLRSAP